MNSIEQLCINLAAEKDNLAKRRSCIAELQVEINQAIPLAQLFFKDQEAGREIARLLAAARNELTWADNAFCSLGGEITTYIADLQK